MSAWSCSFELAGYAGVNRKGIQMRIAYFTESLPPSTDGVAKTMTRLCHSLVSNGIDFRFFSPFEPKHDIPWKNNVIRVPSVPFWLYPDYRVGIPGLQNIFRELDRFRPDLIHAASPTPLGYAGLGYARKKGLPAVSSYHTDFVSYFKYYGFGPFEHVGWSYLKHFYNRFSRIYAPSKSTAGSLKKKGFKNVELWQRGISLNNFSPCFRSRELRRQAGVREDQLMLLFVGRMVREKDLEDLVQVHRILERDRLSFKMVFVGDGPMLPQIRKDCPGAYFTGYQYGDDLAGWYASADIFTFPSTTETFGNVVLEAYASGLPVIGVNRGGVADLIEEGQTGLIARANDPAHFARQLRGLMENPELRLRLGEQARLSVSKNSWESVNGRLLESYRQAISEFHFLKDRSAAA